MTGLLPRAGQATAGEITIDPVVFDELLVLDQTAGPGFLAELVAEFIRATETLLGQLRDAFEISDSVAVARIAHHIRGGCGQLGGRRLDLSCGRLERKASTGRLSRDDDDLEQVETDFQALRDELDRLVPRELAA